MNDKLRAHLEKVRAEVDTWPSHKRNMFGPLPTKLQKKLAEAVERHGGEGFIRSKPWHDGLKVNVPKNIIENIAWFKEWLMTDTERRHVFIQTLQGFDKSKSRSHYSGIEFMLGLTDEKLIKIMLETEKRI